VSEEFSNVEVNERGIRVITHDVTFRAFVKSIAIRDGARVRFEIPEDDYDAILRLARGFKERPLVFAFRADESLPPELELLGSLPTTSSAITLNGGAGEGAVLSVDFPESEMNGVNVLTGLRARPLPLLVEVRVDAA
jgi:hypothetical protein